MAIIETGENQANELLQTHYFRASYEQLKKGYLEILEALGHEVLSVNDDFNEIFSEHGKLEVNTKIIMQSPIETSIDFYINSESFLFPVGRAEKFIQTVLEELEKKFKLKGVALHK